MDAKLPAVSDKESLCFNPRARDGREPFDQSLDEYQISFNPRARDGRECRL